MHSIPLKEDCRAFKSLVIDFKSMPKDRHGYNMIMVIMDRFTKASWSIPCKDKVTARDAAVLYYRGPCRVFGFPDEVISNRGPQFVSQMMLEAASLLNVKWKLATSGHPQTAGRVENLHQYIDQRLRPYINHNQDDWSKLSQHWTRFK